MGAGAGALCSPWNLPEAAASLPSAAMAAVFVAFSLTTTLLSFEVDPLSQARAERGDGRRAFGVAWTPAMAE